jgi:NitT/TauT family transport system permease protein/sulfonate transport system permease protein
MIRVGTFGHDILITLIRFTAGWFLGAGLAVPIGLLTGREQRLLGPMLELNLNAQRAVPVIALVPLITIWFGIGELPKILLVAWGTFFPIWVNTHNGVRAVNPNYLNAARSLGTNVRQLWWRVLLPHVSESILTGLRVSIGVGLICIVAAELVGSFQSGFFSQGLGYRLQVAAQLGYLDRVVACIFTFGVLGWLADKLFTHVARPLVLVLFSFDPSRSTLRVGNSSGS